LLRIQALVLLIFRQVMMCLLKKKPEKSISKHYVGKIRYGYELEGIKYLLNNGII
jgi:hypothetical protein